MVTALARLVARFVFDVRSELNAIAGTPTGERALTAHSGERVLNRANLDALGDKVRTANSGSTPRA